MCRENFAENLKSAKGRDNLNMGCKGLLSFAVGGVFLSIALNVMLSSVFGNDVALMAILVWCAVLSFVGFLLLGYGLKIIIREAKQNIP